jgi:hypothetical protein
LGSPYALYEATAIFPRKIEINDVEIAHEPGALVVNVLSHCDPNNVVPILG